MSDNYRVRIKGRDRADDGRTRNMGWLADGQAWWDVPLPACLDCGGQLVWAEGGHVPGTRACACGSLFSVQTSQGRVWLRRERFYGGGR